MKSLRRILFYSSLLTTVVVNQGSFGQSKFLQSPGIETSSGTITSLPPSNSISHLISEDSIDLWAGTSKGLARTSDGGKSWERFRGLPQFVRDGIFGVSVKGPIVWTSMGYTQTLDDRSVQTGAGYSYSLDAGQSWNYRDQTLDAAGDSIVLYGVNRVNFLPIVVDEQNVTFDLSLSSTHVWIASWSSGIRKLPNQDSTWQRVVLPSDSRNTISPLDTLPGTYYVDPRVNNNFLGFAVHVQDDTTIWAGTAGGVNKSTDAGLSWTKFNRSNQGSPILSNWVIAIAVQRFDSTVRVWTTNWVTGEVGEQFGVSYSDDGGRIWHGFLHGVKAYAFAFKGTTAYVATDDGLYRTTSGGLTWDRSGSIIDEQTGNQITSPAVFTVAVIGDTVFCGTGDGLAKTVDDGVSPFGQRWQIIRAYQPLGTSGTTYAYPNPFDADDEMTRIHYVTSPQGSSVSIEIFDFGMNRVRTLLHGASRTGNVEHDEIWNGRDDDGDLVSNGVYFYRVILDDTEPIWGKVLVLK